MKCDDCGKDIDDSSTIQLCEQCIDNIMEEIKKDPEKFKRQIKQIFPDVEIYHVANQQTGRQSDRQRVKDASIKIEKTVVDTDGIIHITIAGTFEDLIHILPFGMVQDPRFKDIHDK